MNDDGVRGDGLLSRPIRYGDIQLGRPIDLLLDVEAMRTIGFQVVCSDALRRFLPFPAVRIRDEAIEVGSALVVLEEEDVPFYRQRAHGLRTLRGNRVVSGRSSLGELRDVVVDREGAIHELVVEGADGERRVRLDRAVRFVEVGGGARG